MGEDPQIKAIAKILARRYAEARYDLHPRILPNYVEDNWENFKDAASEIRDAAELAAWRPVSNAPREATPFLGLSMKYGWCGTVRFDEPEDKMPEMGNPNWEFMAPVNIQYWRPQLILPKEPFNA